MAYLRFGEPARLLVAVEARPVAGDETTIPVLERVDVFSRRHGGFLGLHCYAAPAGCGARARSAARRPSSASIASTMRGLALPSP